MMDARHWMPSTKPIRPGVYKPSFWRASLKTKALGQVGGKSSRVQPETQQPFRHHSPPVPASSSRLFSCHPPVLSGLSSKAQRHSRSPPRNVTLAKPKCHQRMWAAGWGWGLGVKIMSRSHLLLLMARRHCALRPSRWTKSKAAASPGRSCFHSKGISPAVSMFPVYTE